MRPGFTIVTIAVLALVVPSTTHAAQAPPRSDTQLETVQSLIRNGRLADARTALDAWNAAHPPTDITPGDIRAWALILRARIATSWERAEEALRAVALGYPVSPHAPEALLRLGQGLLARASVEPASNALSRATGYLDRLVTEYPADPLRGPALLWLARAHRLAARVPQACARLDDALALDLDAQTRALVAEERRNCPPRAPAARDTL
jgi:outer membrane protein assembly factor BamD (BamD/ComL family)